MGSSPGHLARFGLPALIAGSALAAASPVVLAYPGVPATIAITSAVGCSAVPLGGTCTIVARVSSSEGLPVAGATVSWTVSLPPGGSITPNPSTTDANGSTTVTYHAPSTATASAPGERFLASVVHLAAISPCTSGTVTASTGGLSASTQVTVVCTSNASSKLLPVTSTDPPAGSRVAVVGMGIVGGLIAVGGVARLRRSRRQTV